MSKIIKIRSQEDIYNPCILNAKTIVISDASKILNELGIDERHKYFTGKCSKNIEIVDNFLFSVDSTYHEAAGDFSEIFENCYECLRNGGNVILPVSSDNNDSILLAEIFMAGKKISDSCAGINQDENISFPVVVGRNNNNEVIWAVDSQRNENRLFCSLGSQYNDKDINEKLDEIYGLNLENTQIIQKDFEEPPSLIKDFFNDSKFFDILLRTNFRKKLEKNLQLIKQVMSQVEHHLTKIKYSKGENNLKKITEYAPEFYIELWNLISDPKLHITDKNKDKETTKYIKKFLKSFILSKQATRDALKDACEDLAKKIMTYRMIDKAMFSKSNIIKSFDSVQYINYITDEQDNPPHITILHTNGKINLIHIGNKDGLTIENSDSNNINKNTEIIELKISNCEGKDFKDITLNHKNSNIDVSCSHDATVSTHKVHIDNLLKFLIMHQLTVANTPLVYCTKKMLKKLKKSSSDDEYEYEMLMQAKNDPPNDLEIFKLIEIFEEDGNIPEKICQALTRTCSWVLTGKKDNDGAIHPVVETCRKISKYSFQPKVSRRVKGQNKPSSHPYSKFIINCNIHYPNEFIDYCKRVFDDSCTDVDNSPMHVFFDTLPKAQD